MPTEAEKVEKAVGQLSREGLLSLLLYHASLLPHASFLPLLPPGVELLRVRVRVRVGVRVRVRLVRIRIMFRIGDKVKIRIRATTRDRVCARIWGLGLELGLG